MNCLSQMIGCLSSTLEQLGLYEPQISAREAKDRLRLETQLWKRFHRDRNELWRNFQMNNFANHQVPPLVKKAITHLESHGIKKGIAVDLGCGISPTTFNLLERGWKVYAVDSSLSVIKALKEEISSLGKTWIQDGQLVLVNQTIEKFEFPEKVDLVTATDSLPYCNPKKITKILLEIKKSLRPQGVLACDLLPYNDDPLRDNLLRGIFGGWMTTKNVVEAVVKSVDFPTCSVTDEMSPAGITKQFHIFAQG